jgi:ATP-dependent Clp protease adapter protein ClpS
VTPFELVIFALQRAAGLSVEVAEMVAQEAHAHGQAVAKRGLTLEDARIVAGLLARYSALPGVCPGVRCEVEPDVDG